MIEKINDFTNYTSKFNKENLKILKIKNTSLCDDFVNYISKYKNRLNIKKNIILSSIIIPGTYTIRFFGETINNSQLLNIAFYIDYDEYAYVTFELSNRLYIVNDIDVSFVVYPDDVRNVEVYKMETYEVISFLDSYIKEKSILESNGLDQSILPHTKWNGFTNWYYGSEKYRQEDFWHNTFMNTNKQNQDLTNNDDIVKFKDYNMKKKKEISPLENEAKYVEFLKRKINSENYKKNVSKDEYKETLKKYDKAKLKLKFLKEKEGK